MGCLQSSGEVVKTPRADMPAGSGTGEDIGRLLLFDSYCIFQILEFSECSKHSESQQSSQCVKRENCEFNGPQDLTSRYQEAENPQSMAAVTRIRRSQLSWASAAWDVDQQGEPLECQPYVDLQMLGAPGTE